MVSPAPIAPARLLPLAAFLVTLLLLTGCGSGIQTSCFDPQTGTAAANCGTPPTPPTPPVPPPVTYAGSAFSGKVFSGTTPIVSAAIQLFAAGTTGNGSSPTTLLSTILSTDATGSFTVAAGYPCPAAASQLYVVARGGKVGALSTNTAITLVTTIGRCDALPASASYVLNEVTTAATAWALSQFLVPGAVLGYTGTNTQGIANAVAIAANLANPNTGATPGATFPANGISPAAKINALANLLNTCTASGTCTRLFSLATPASATAPSNTLDAAYDIIRNPGTNVAALYTQSLASTAFAPTIATAPADWTLFITFTGGGMNYPASIGVDSTGSLWVASYFNTASKFSPIGASLFPNGITGSGLNESYGLAIDAKDNVWITNGETPYSVNNGLGSITEFNSAGQPLSGAGGYSAGGIYYPAAIAIDTNAVVWVVDNGNSHITQLNSSGQPLSGASGYTTPFFYFPIAIALDAAHNAWVGNQGDINVTRVTADLTQATNFTCCNSPSSVAIDQRGFIWVANYYGDSISQLSSTGTVISSSYTGGGTISHPQGLAIDGAGSVWTTSFLRSNLTRLAGSNTANPGQPLSPTNGFATDAGLLGAYAVAIDASGNLWISNLYGDKITQFIGLAVPVKTPLLGPAQTP